MKLFSYIVTHDTGFSPNPFWGYCTLADCKPAIRRTANVGDWIVGLSPKAEGNKIVYAMEVKEILTFHEYYHDKRFSKKIPDYTLNITIYKTGDNIYKPLKAGGFQQLQSFHSDGLNERHSTKNHDLGGKNVLVSDNYYYFGSEAIPLHPDLKELIVARGHKNHFSQEVIQMFLDYISKETKKIKASPSKWPENDLSWEIGK